MSKIVTLSLEGTEAQTEGTAVAASDKPYRIHFQIQIEPETLNELPDTEALYREESKEFKGVRMDLKNKNPRKPGKMILKQTSGVSMKKILPGLKGYTYVGGNPELRNKNRPNEMIVVKMNYVRDDMVTGKPAKAKEEARAQQLYFQHHNLDIKEECEQFILGLVCTAWAYLNDANDQPGEKTMVITLDTFAQPSAPKKFLTIEGSEIVLQDVMPQDATVPQTA